MSRWPNKYVIGLTGNIATGKSVVRQMLQHSGAYTIDADGLAHRAMMPGAPAYKPIVETFGQFIVGEDKRINRALLGKIVFSNPEALKKLEAITHPVIRQAVDALVKRSNKRVVVIEAIKLLEGDLKDWVDAVWVVSASRKTQYQRLLSKRKLSEDEAKQRILAQGAQDEKVKQADVVIDNDGDIEKTWQQVNRAWKDIVEELRGSQQKAGAAEAIEEEAASTTIGVEGLTVRRGTPAHAEQIAQFMNTIGGRQNVSRIDVMMAFGEKSFLVAQDGGSNLVALLGWTVEDLVTRMDDFILKQGAPTKETVHALVQAVEEASKELESEVGFCFLPESTPEAVINAFNEDGYAVTSLQEIKIPAWRDAVKEELDNKSAQGQLQVLWKQLRKDRVLQPI